MRIAITQPNYLPWLGYFDLLDSVDCFVALDDVQLVRRSFIVRNRVLSPAGGPRWLSLPVVRCPQKTPLNRALVSHEPSWWDGTLQALDAAYRLAPHWPWLRGTLVEVLRPGPAESVADYNLRLLAHLCTLLGCSPAPWYRSSEIAGRDGFATSEDHIIAICGHLGAHEYFNFRKGVEIGLYEPARFASNGLRLWGQDYSHPTYGQAPGQPFTSQLSIVDLLAWQGPERALAIIRAGRCWQDLAPRPAA